MSNSPATFSRGIVQWVVTIVFGVLSAAFLLRALQYGYKWLSGAVEPEVNFKAMTIWALVYVLVCAGIAAVAFFMPREADDDDRPENNQKAERGT